MSAVETAQALMVGESHVRHEESKQWCVAYRTVMLELAIEVDALRAENFALKHANPERWKTEIASILKKVPDTTNKLTKAEATSKRMKAWWAQKKAQKAP